MILESDQWDSKSLKILIGQTYDLKYDLNILK